MFDIILNPNGGHGASLKALKVVEQCLKDANQDYTIHKTEYAGHAIQLAKELNESSDDLKLIVLGGDGTFNEVLNGLTDLTKVTMGIIPCGSGNDFIKASGHPKKYKEAMDVILQGSTSYVDYIKVGDKRCLNVAGAGMDVDVLTKYATVKKLKGKAAYYYSLFYTLAHAKFHHMEITINGGEPLERSVFMIGIGNGQFIGGGLKVCPNAVIDDGKLEVVIINEIKKSKIIAKLPKFLSGKHLACDFTEEFVTDKLHIKVLDDSQFQFDGEVQPVEMKEMDMECVHKELKMFR